MAAAAIHARTGAIVSAARYRTIPAPSWSVLDFRTITVAAPSAVLAVGSLQLDQLAPPCHRVACHSQQLLVPEIAETCGAWHQDAANQGAGQRRGLCLCPPLARRIRFTARVSVGIGTATARWNFLIELA